jgi:hypothetical protein
MSIRSANTILDHILSQQLTQPECDWLKEKSAGSALDIMTAFVSAPRFLARNTVSPATEDALDLTEAYPGFSIQNWDTVRLSRVWLLTCLDSSVEEAYVRHIETLFDTAEMNELVALYSALPLLAYPKEWLFRATEAVRSNVGDVFDSLVIHNPYPAQYFSELAWNQLVLKTIFNDKPIHGIVGLEERANAKLALMLSDFAHERWAAGRSVAPEVWRLTPGFMNETLVEDMKVLFGSGNEYNRQAAALACFHSDHHAAQQLLNHYPELKKRIEQKELSWADLEFKDLNTYVSES